MKKITKIFSLFLALTMIFTLCSCGDDKSKEDGNKEETTTEPISNLNLEIGCGKTFAANGHHTVALLTNGKVLATGDNEYGQCNVSSWEDIVAVDNSDGITVGLKSNGTVVAVGFNEEGQCNVNNWTNIVAISTSSYNTVGVKSDGTVVATGNNDHGQCNVSEWTDIVSVATSGISTYGIKKDGTVVATGNNDFGQCNVAHWTDIVKIVSNGYFVVGLKNDGTVICSGNNMNNDDFYFPDDWTDIKDIDFLDGFVIFGLKNDGSIVCNSYSFDEFKDDYSSLNGAIALSGNLDGMVALMPDGTLTTYEDAFNMFGQCNFSSWNNIQLPKSYNR